MSQSDKTTKNSAVALKYNPDIDYAPIVVASGHGEAAKHIIEIADDNCVPIFRDDSTTALLTMLDIGQGIPSELYDVIAAIYVEILTAAKSVSDKENSDTQTKASTN